MVARRERLHDNIREEIKAIARQHMATEGTAAISLRAIARDMEMTAPALYRYFPSRDDLITALIVDAFTALADTLQAADAAHAATAPIERVWAVLLAYRQWALQNPTDFQLIYGNPIPGYTAPGEVTIPQVQRGFSAIMGAMQAAVASGDLHLPADAHLLPSAIHTHFAALIGEGQYPIDPGLFYLGIVAWTRIHGIIMLELYHHLGPTVGDVEAFYRHEIASLLRQMRAG